MILEPVPYLEMQRLEMNARVILTDSGGMQKEAHFHGVPSITLRDETEWVETVQMSWNQLAGTRQESIIRAYRSQKSPDNSVGMPYDKGAAGQKLVRQLLCSKIC